MEPFAACEAEAAEDVPLQTAKKILRRGENSYNLQTPLSNMSLHVWLSMTLHTSASRSL